MTTTTARALIVDDDPPTRKLLEKILGIEKFDVDTVATGARALELLEGEKYDLLVLDLMMPGVSGFEVAERLERSAQKPRCLVVLTAVPDRHLPRMRELATFVVQKPFDVDLLRSRIRACMELPSPAEVTEDFGSMVAHQSKEGALVLARDGTVVYANPAGQEMLTGQRQSLDARNAFRWIHAGDGEGVRSAFEELLLRQDGVREVTFRVSREGDQGRVLAASIRSVLSRSGVALLMLTTRDVTEAIELEKARLQDERLRALGGVASVVAHELKNVLMAVHSLNGVIARSDDLEHIRGTSDLVSTAVTRGKRVTDQVLQFAQGSHPELRCLDLGELLRTIAPELRAIVGSGTALELQQPREPVPVMADPYRIQQVMTNLVSNASDALSGHGTIRVSLEVELEELRPICLLRVTDDGPGISRDVLRHLFEPFFTTKGRQGTGLGLAISRQIVQAHRGDLEVESLPGRETTFTILLPMAAATMPLLCPASASDAKLCGRVLLVDDEEVIGEAVAELLRMEGMEARHLTSGVAIVSAIEAFRPDAVVLDIGLPDLDGLGVFALIEDRFPSLPVVFATGDGDDTKLRTILERASVGFIQKPYPMESLLKILATVCGAG